MIFRKFLFYLKAADYINVTNKVVLVIGTRTPWLESILIVKQPKKIVTVEYGAFER